MAKTSIAELNVKLTASAEAFDKEIDKVEKRLTGFANTATSSLNSLRGLGGGVGDLFTKPFGAFMGDVSRFANMIPGIATSFGGLLDPAKFSEKMQTVIDRTMDLSRESQRLGVDPQFLRGLRAASGPEADAVEKGLLKFSRILGELKVGSEDLTRAGGSKASKLFEKWGMDIAAFTNMTQDQAFLSIARKYQSIGDRAEQAAFGMDMMGKGAANAHNTLAAGTTNIEKYIAKVKELGIGTQEQIALAKAYKLAMKDIGLVKEGYEDRAFQMYGGAMELGKAKFWAGDISGGLADYGGGLANMFGGFGTRRRYMPEEMKAAMDKYAAEQHGPNKIGDIGEDTLRKMGLDPGKMHTPAVQDEAITKALELQDLLEKQYEETHKATPEMQLQVVMQSKISDVLKQSVKDAYERNKVFKDDLEMQKSMVDLFKQNEQALLATGRGITEGVMTAPEKAQRDMEKASEIFGRGNITEETYRRYLQNLRRSLTGVSGGPSEANVALKGSQEWAKGFNRQAERTDEDMLDIQKQSKDVLERIDDKLGKLKPPTPVQAPP